MIFHIWFCQRCCINHLPILSPPFLLLYPISCNIIKEPAFNIINSSFLINVFKFLVLNFIFRFLFKNKTNNPGLQAHKEKTTKIQSGLIQDFSFALWKQNHFILHKIGLLLPNRALSHTSFLLIFRRDLWRRWGQVLIYPLRARTAAKFKSGSNPRVFFGTHRAVQAGKTCPHFMTL